MLIYESEVDLCERCYAGGAFSCTVNPEPEKATPVQSRRRREIIRKDEQINGRERRNGYHLVGLGPFSSQP
jgi:hypothetical protein